MRHFLSAGLALMAVLAAFPARSASPPPASFDSRFAVARGLALGGNRTAAIEAYSALLAESPGNSDVLVGRGRVYAWQQRWAESEQDLLAATQVSPRYADAWSALGDLYLWSDRPALAVETYSRWMEIAPQDADARAARGRAHRAAGNREAARADFEAAGERGMDVAGLLASLVPAAKPSQGVEPIASAEVAVQLAGSRNAESFIPDQYRWTAGLSVDNTRFRDSGTNWTDSVASIRRGWDNASLGFEVLQSRRFGITDRAFALDGYAPLWPRAYLNARFQLADDGRLFPHNRWRAELFQGVGQGWELSGGYDRLGFDTAVELVSLGVGRYVGNWYFRLRHLYVPGTATSPAASNSDRLTGRYYYRGDADRYIEASGSFGRAEPSTTTTTTTTTNARNSASYGFAWSGRLTGRIGFKLSYNHGYGYESQAAHHDGLSGSIYARW